MTMLIAMVAIVLVVMSIGWLGWVMWKMDTDDDDWNSMSSPFESDGLGPGFTIVAVCPECNNGRRTDHRLLAVEPEGDLIECAADDQHWWVRGEDERKRERAE